MILRKKDVQFLGSTWDAKLTKENELFLYYENYRIRLFCKEEGNVSKENFLLGEIRKKIEGDLYELITSGISLTQVTSSSRKNEENGNFQNKNAENWTTEDVYNWATFNAKIDKTEEEILKDELIDCIALTFLTEEYLKNSNLKLGFRIELLEEIKNLK